MTDASPFTNRSLTGGRLALAGFVLAASNFMVVLDTTIANVSIPHIAGALSITPSEGTWVITSYSVAEAICVPLTGWLAKRFGTVRLFVMSLIGFGFFSLLCGLSGSLGLLVAFRVAQGLCGGPLLPITQTLILRIFPPEKQAMAMGVWAITTVTAPIVGPIFGGLISDDLSWSWIFFINLPVAAFCAFASTRLLTVAETPIESTGIDYVGLVLLAVWVGALQIMLDTGREHDWFSSDMVTVLGVVAAVGFVAFLIWELTAEEPVVDLRVMRHRGFTVSVAVLSMTFGTMFAGIVIVPQWLQNWLGYTATLSGYVAACSGILAVTASPIVAKLASRYDPRAIASIGILWLSATALMRLDWSSGSDFQTLALPQLLQGVGIPCFFVTLTTIGLSAVLPRETASAAGIMAFMRTLAGAVATSVATTSWETETRLKHNELAGVLNRPDAFVDTLKDAGFSAEQGRGVIGQLVDQEAVALATNHIFVVAACIFVLAATLIWLAPRPQRAVDRAAAH